MNSKKFFEPGRRTGRGRGRAGYGPCARPARLARVRACGPAGGAPARPSITAVLSATVLILGLVSSVWGQVASQDPQTVPVTPTNTPRSEPEPLSLPIPDAFQEGRNLFDLGPLSAAQIAAADEAFAAEFDPDGPLPPRVGLTRSVGAEPQSIARGSAQRITLPNGSLVWTLAIRSPGALGLRVHFSQFDVGAGRVLVYGRDRTGVVALGPYTGKGPDGQGTFLTATLPGDTAYIEVTGTEDPQVAVDEVGHFDNDPALDPDGMEPTALQPCELDVMCFGNPPVHPFARDATVRLNWREPSGGFGQCSGTILNALDDETFVPYLLTAYHCFHDQTPQADTLEAVYFWQRNSCGGPLPDYSTLPRSNGARLLERNPTDDGNDMTFVRLNGDLPNGATLAGWTTGDLPSQTVAIHHPGGDWKRVTFGQSATGGPRNCFPSSQYHYIHQDSGATEPGSSGHALFDSSARVYGQWYGACHDRPPDPCNQRDRWNDMYGRFSITYPLIRRWLEIGGTIHVNRFYPPPLVEQGTPSQPFRTVSAANNLINSQAWDGARIKIQAASYPEVLTITRRVTLIANGGTVTIGQ